MEFKDSRLPYDEGEVIGFNHPHGTGVASILSRDPNVVEILPINGVTNPSLAVKRAREQGARIINCSWGPTDDAPPGEVEAWEKAISSAPDLLFVFAAGNSHRDLDAKPLPLTSWPAKNKMVVASTDADGKLSSFSNFGKGTVDLAALGSKVPVAKPGGGYQTVSGTSYSAPAVARAAAEVRSANPNLSPEQIIGILTRSASKKTELLSTLKSGGILNEEAAVKMARESLQPKAVAALP
jgi:subtilisin family serine protease